MEEHDTDEQAARARTQAADARSARLRAAAAVAGWQLLILTGGVPALSRWGRLREFASLDEAEEFLARVAAHALILDHGQRAPAAPTTHDPVPASSCGQWL